MNTNVRASLNHSYFYDALSGNFMPPSDTENVGLSLARLMSETMERGQISNPNSHNGRYTYLLPWASVISEVHTSHWDIKSLTLSASDRELKVVHTLEGNKPRRLKVYDSDLGLDPVFDAELGYRSDYYEIQERVRNVAKSFFDVIPPSCIADVN